MNGGYRPKYMGSANHPTATSIFACAAATSGLNQYRKYRMRKWGLTLRTVIEWFHPITIEGDTDLSSITLRLEFFAIHLDGVSV
jgi:hypothetical protein